MSTGAEDTPAPGPQASNSSGSRNGRERRRSRGKKKADPVDPDEGDDIETGKAVGASVGMAKPMESQPSSLDLFSKGTWSVQETWEHMQAKLHRQNQKRTLAFYIVFLLVFAYVVFSLRDPLPSNLAQNAIKDALFDEEFEQTDAHIKKTFFHIGDWFEFWQWVNGPLLNAINNDVNPDGSQTDEKHMVYQVNKLVGAIQFRQLRVRPDACEVPQPYREVTQRCYGFLDRSKNVDTAPFGGPDNATFTYAEEQQASGIYGRWGEFYEGFGHIANVPRYESRAEYDTAIQDLIDYDWIDRYTRVAFVHLNFYNAAVNHFIVVTAVLEINPGGGIEPWVQWHSIRLDPYLTPADNLRLVAEIIFLVLLLAYMVSEGLEMKQRGLLNYAYDPWNALDLVNLGLFIVALVMYGLYLTSGLRNQFSKQLSDPDSYLLLQNASTLYLRLFSVLAFNMLLSVIKVFKFLQFNAEMNLMWKTLRKAWPDLRTFVIFIFIVIVGFGAFAWLLFGPELTNYRDFTRSISTVLQITLGQFDYTEMRNVNRVLAPVFFVSFVVLVFFTLVNIFLAILNDAYAHEKKRTRPVQRSMRSILGDFVNTFKSTTNKDSAKRKVSNARVRKILQQFRDDNNDARTFSTEDLKRELDKYTDDHYERVRLHQIVDQMEKRQREAMRALLQRQESAMFSDDGERITGTPRGSTAALMRTPTLNSGVDMENMAMPSDSGAGNFSAASGPMMRHRMAKLESKMDKLLDVMEKQNQNQNQS